MRSATLLIHGTAMWFQVAVANVLPAQVTTWPPPRKAAPIELRPLWSIESDELLTPADVHFSRAGLLVFDHGSHSIKLLDTRAGRVSKAMGRQGGGPGEFRNPAQFFGTIDTAYVVEFSFGNVSRVARDSVTHVRVASGGRWSSGCRLDREHLLLQASRRETHDFFRSTMGDNARIVDSLALPWPSLVARPSMERQAQLRQLDDSTCAILPLYQREFAILRPSGRMATGANVEELPKAELVVTKAMEALRGKPGALDARAWREFVLVLFGGTSVNKFRTLDVYERGTLRYAGSVKLPMQSMRIAVRGDTLAVMGERDDTPVISGFLLSRRR